MHHITGLGFEDVAHLNSDMVEHLHAAVGVQLLAEVASLCCRQFRVICRTIVHLHEQVHDNFLELGNSDLMVRGLACTAL